MSKAKNPYIIQSVKELPTDISQLPPKLEQKWQNYQKILALVVHNQLKYPNIADICALIQEQSTSSYAYDH